MATPAKTNGSPANEAVTVFQGILLLSVKWSVQAISYTHTITVNKTPDCNRKAPTPTNLNQKTVRAESRTVVYREYFIRLLSVAKPLRDQLIIELPTLQAFRSGEVSSLRAEWIDFENGDIQVLDSKKGTMATLPLDHTFGKHADEYIKRTGIHEGILIQPLPGAPHTGRKPGSKTLGAGLSIKTIEKVFEIHCKRCGVPVMSPRMGRAYWATVEHFVLGKPTAYIQFMLRHDDLQSTEHYLSRIVSYGDMKTIFYWGKKAEFSQGQLSPFSLSTCQRSGNCPLAAPGCRCRMFHEGIEVKPKP